VFCKAQKKTHPDLQKSFRFYRTCNYRTWLKESVTACQDSIAVLTELLTSIGQAAPRSAGPLSASFKVNQMLSEDFDGEQLLLSLKSPAMDNYSFNREQFPDLCNRAKFLPLVDMCCDVLGTNAMCPFYYSARTDAR